MAKTGTSIIEIMGSRYLTKNLIPTFNDKIKKLNDLVKSNPDAIDGIDFTGFKFAVKSSYVMDAYWEEPIGQKFFSNTPGVKEIFEYNKQVGKTIVECNKAGRYPIGYSVNKGDILFEEMIRRIKTYFKMHTGKRYVDLPPLSYSMPDKVAVCSLAAMLIMYAIDQDITFLIPSGENVDPIKLIEKLSGVANADKVILDRNHKDHKKLQEWIVSCFKTKKVKREGNSLYLILEDIEEERKQNDESN